jgi:RNA polymerase sigma factor (sigma-70 family)
METPATSVASAARKGGAVAPVRPAESLAELFTREESGLLRFAYGFVARREVAEELVQEAFMRLHQHWDEVENPRAWLFRSVRNLALNHIRDHSRERELPEGELEGNAEVPAEVLGRLEAIGMMRLLLAEMAPEDRALVELKYHEDLKYNEISDRTGLSVGNVGYKLHHLLKGMGEALRRAGIDGSRG